jgi:DNA-binding Lrp family transcriptional regulator
MDAADRAIVNHLQRGLPVCATPYAQAARELGMSEAELLERLGRLLADGTLMRFGPLYNSERLGGAVTLAALSVPAQDFARVAALVNAFPEVTHNYEREHALNMWFVVASDDPARIDEVIAAIEHQSGYRVFNLPKREEFFVGLRFTV